MERDEALETLSKEGVLLVLCSLIDNMPYVVAEAAVRRSRVSHICGFLELISLVLNLQVSISNGLCSPINQISPNIAEAAICRAQGLIMISSG